MPDHPAIAEGRVSVVTGGASGIGLATARRLGAAGMIVVVADLPGRALDDAVADLRSAGVQAVACPTDVTRRAEVEALRQRADSLGTVTVLMSNAGREGGGGLFAGEDVWRKTLDVNLWGSIHITQVFAPGLIAGQAPAAVIYTGSKQGITLPPGDTAYNVSKAALRAFAESVSHEFVQSTGGRVTAHLLIPGFTFTGFTRARGVTEKPSAAWTADEVAKRLCEGLAAGEFYILCPDNEVDRETDLKRIRWGFGDILENRPALSRWHPNHTAAFARSMKDSE